MRQHLLIVIFAMGAAFMSSLLSSNALAQSETKKAGGKKSTSINFEDQLVEGQAQKPELFYLLQKKQFNYKRLIRLRDDFLPEMRKTSEDISRKGSGN